MPGTPVLPPAAVRLVAARLEPRQATWQLTCGAVALAGCSTAALALRAARLDADDGIVVVPGPAIEAYALPGWPGRIHADSAAAAADPAARRLRRDRPARRGSRRGSGQGPARSARTRPGRPVTAEVAPAVGVMVRPVGTVRLAGRAEHGGECVT